MGKSWKDKRDKWERSDKNKRNLSSKAFKGGKKNRDKKVHSYEEDDTSSSF